MSRNLASRYIGGVPYGPGRSVGRYPNAASAEATPGVVGGVPGFTPGTTGGDASGGITAPTLARASGSVAPAVPVAGGASGGGSSNMLATLLGGAGLLQYLPDAYNYVFGDNQPETPPAAYPSGPIYSGLYPEGSPLPEGAQFLSRTGPVTLPPGATMGPEGIVELPDGSFYDSTSWTQIPVQPGEMDGLINAPTEGGLIDGAPGQGGWLSLPQGAVLSAADDPLTGSLGTVGGADLATGLAGAGGGALGGWIAGQAPWTQQGYGAIGSQAGSAVGGVAAGALIGSAAGPIGTAAGALAGALLGGWGGGAAGSQIGPLPTIGRNYSSIGTFDGSGALNWGNSGGDNGGSAADADPFATWFQQNLAQQAAQQGLQFNPNMTGAQIRVGAYDNFSRNGPSPAGGFFYTPDTGGSPENYALRPSDDFANDAYSPGQANAFTTNVLADLAARGVYTQPGAQQPGMDYWGASQGTPLGWYGAQGGQYDAIQNGGSDFTTLLGARQNAVQGWQAGAAQRQFNTDTAMGYRDALYAAQIGPDGNPIYANGPAPALDAAGNLQADGGA